VADGGLAESQPFRNGACAAVDEEFAKDQEQAAVEPSDFQLIEITHETNSVA